MDHFVYCKQRKRGTEKSLEMPGRWLSNVKKIVISTEIVITTNNKKEKKKKGQRRLIIDSRTKPHAAFYEL